MVVRLLEWLKRLDASDAALIPAFLVFAVWGFPWLNRFLFDRRTKVRRPKNRARERRARKYLWWIVGGGVGLMWALPIVLLTTSTRTMPTPAAIWGSTAHVTLYVAQIGCVIVATGILSRRGSRVVCASCEYPMGSWRGAPPACPECGRAWKRPWKARVGVRTLRSAYIAWGGVLVLTSIGLGVLSLYMVIQSVLR
jgi:hypothetical protein